MLFHRGKVITRLFFTKNNFSFLASALITTCVFHADFGNFSDTYEMASPKDCRVMYEFPIFMMMKMMNCFFPARIIARDPHHQESPTCRKQVLNLCRT